MAVADSEYGVIKCYYNSQTTGQSDTGKGEPRTTLQMTYPYSCVVYLNWNSEGHVWQDDTDNSNNGYPEFGDGFFRLEPVYPTNDNIMYLGDFITPAPIQNDNIMYLGDYIPVSPVTITHNLINNTIEMT